MMADKSGLELETLAGMAYDPLSGLWRMTEDTGVNYIAYFQKSGLVTGEPCAAVLHSQSSNASYTNFTCFLAAQRVVFA